MTKVVITKYTVSELMQQFRKNTAVTNYRGYAPDIMRNIIASSLFMSVYGVLRDKVPTEKHNYFLFGVASSIGSWSVTYPLDTIRVLKQSSDNAYSDIIRQNYRRLYRGFSLVLLRAMPSAGLGMVAYEKTRSYTDRYLKG